ncbi:MAG: hypothetical protein JW904_02035 [Spirochaetales bacterium]|nr:hypothetical protein [Spirochaetales bacterium]
MKNKTFAILVLLVLLPAFVMCGDDQGAQPGKNGNSGTASTLYPSGTLDPATVSADKPVSAKQLYEAYFAWNGKKVTIAAYPYIPYMRETQKVEKDLRLRPDTEAKDSLLTALFAESPGREVAKDELVAVQGTLKMSWTGKLELTNAVFVDAPAALEYKETSPWVYDGVTPIPLKNFHAFFSIWIDKEVLVEGYYHSTTTSTTSYGTTIRVDLAEPGDIYKKYVACEMKEAIPETVNKNLVDKREGVQIKGILKGESFSIVGLEECVIVNR